MRKNLLFAASMLLIGSTFSQSIQIGQSTNSFTMLRGCSNQIFVNEDLNTVGMIYRQNQALYGGDPLDNGIYRYAVSTDGGVTWNDELGPLQTTYTRRGRYPNAALYNPAGNTVPTGSYIVWGGSTLTSGATPQFDGLVNGTAQLTTSGAVTTTENYQFFGGSGNIVGGLVEGTPGTFWMVEYATQNDTSITDTINVYKGIFASGSVNWTKMTVTASNNNSFDGDKRVNQPNVAFSPNGQIGYVTYLGDIGTSDTSYNLIYFKTTDGGTTWGTANEIIIDQVGNARDSITSILFSDGAGGFEICGTVGTGFDYDVIVDSLGNLHMATVLMCIERTDTFGVAVSGGEKQFSVFSGYPKWFVDIFTNDGGGTWKCEYIAPINTFRGEIPDPTPVSVDNYPQIARSKNGNVLFYSWSDTDTLLIPGTTDNTNPSIFIASRRLTDGKKTCWNKLTNITVEDDANTPTMSTIVLQSSNVDGIKYNLPIAYQEVLTNATSPVNIHYAGNIADFCEADYKDPATLDLLFNVNPAGCYNYVPCAGIGLDEELAVTFNVFPNPTTDFINVVLTKGDNISSIQVVNALGQVVYTIDPSTVDLNTNININVSGFAAGIYSINMNTNTKMYSSKFTVVK